MRRISRWLILGLVAAGCGQSPTPVADYAAQRERMVKEQMIMRGISGERVLAAMRKVPREESVPEQFRAESSFSSLSAAEDENGESRIFLGIHWSFDKTEGIHQGQNVADYVFSRVFQPLH